MMRIRQHHVVLAITFIILTAVVGSGPSALIGAVRAEPVTPADVLPALEGPAAGAVPGLEEIDLAVPPADVVPAPAGPDLAAAPQTFWAIAHNNTSGPSLAVDAQGGVHAAFSGYSVDPNTSTYPVYYLYCAANCADPANWVWTRVGQVGMGASDCDGVRLALDPQGRPRLMWYYLSSPLAAQGTWHYAECNANCTNAGSWADYAVVDVDPYRGFPGKGRYFALDPQGRPHFIYRDLTGTYYALCDGNCASGGQWRAFRLNESLHLYDASLAFSSSGMARLAYRTGNYLAYYEYVGDANYAVDPANSWSGGLFFTLGSEPMYSLRLDAQNRPRLAIYTNGRLSYAWC